MCPYCVRAKRLLSGKGVDFVEIDLWQFPARRDEMIASEREAAGPCRRFSWTARALGGSDEFQALEVAGRLDPLLASRAAVQRAELGGK